MTTQKSELRRLLKEDLKCHPYGRLVTQEDRLFRVLYSVFARANLNRTLRVQHFRLWRTPRGRTTFQAVLCDGVPIRFSFYGTLRTIPSGELRGMILQRNAN